MIRYQWLYMYMWIKTVKVLICTFCTCKHGMGTLGRLIIIIIEYGVFKVHTTYTIRIVAYTLVDSDQTESDRNFVTSTRDTRS